MTDIKDIEQRAKDMIEHCQREKHGVNMQYWLIGYLGSRKDKQYKRRSGKEKKRNNQNNWKIDGVRGLKKLCNVMEQSLRMC